jgi:ketosteroid isomerase-like protein
MSEANLETAKALFAGPIDMTAAIATPEALEAALAHFEPRFHADLETVHDPRAAAMGIGGSAGEGVSAGIDGFIELWRDYLSAWDSWVVTPTGFSEVADGRVLVLLTYEGRSKTHGTEMTFDGANILTVRDGKVARVELFFNRLDALEAAGLPESGQQT